MVIVMKVRNELNLQLYEQKMDGTTLPHYKDEYIRYKTIQNGDAEATAILVSNGTLKLYNPLRLLSENSSRNLCYHFAIEASTLARLCMEGGLSHDEAYTISDIYIRKLDRITDVAEIEKLYKQMCMDYAARMGEIRKESAISSHVRKCIDYIYENLGGDLSMQVLAGVTGLNPSYLSRLFSKEIGCPIKQFILSAKVDTAQNLLRHSELPYSKIAVSLGFSSQSAFITVFRKFVHMTPRAYREYDSLRGIKDTNNETDPGQLATK